MRQHYASPGGSPGGNGTPSNPWDLATALAHPATVKPGDTLWLRGGTYDLDATIVCSLTGTAAKPLTVRARPHESVLLRWSKLDILRALDIRGSYTRYQGFEMVNTAEGRVFDAGGEADERFRGCALFCQPAGLGVQLVNIHAHDFGFSVFESSQSAIEVYGCRFYNSWWEAPDRSHGPGLYMRNNPAWPGRKRIENNIVFQHGRQGLQGFGSQPFANFDVVGNIFFNNGIPGFHRNLFFGSAAGGHGGNVYEGNCTYFPEAGGAHAFNQFGGDTGAGSLVLENNVIVAENRVAAGFREPLEATLRGNLLFGRVQRGPESSPNDTNGAGFRALYPDNDYYGSDAGVPARPEGVQVHARLNRFLPDPSERRGVAHVAVYNWALRGEVAIDLGPLFGGANAHKEPPLGSLIAVSSAQNPAQTLALRYDGRPLRVPMSGWTPAPMIGADPATHPIRKTFPEFGCFYLSWPVWVPRASARGNPVRW